MAEDDVRSVDVKAVFRHSAGELGSHYLTTLRDEGQLLGWRSGRPPIVRIPPKDLGLPGSWVDVGPGATLEAYAPRDWLQAAGAEEWEDGSCLALVRPDGADTAMLARLRPAAASAVMGVGQRLTAHFAERRSGSATDVWFEVAAE